ncbi:MAG TPA: hypothetical protein DDY91_16350 [Planctomycetaceae bacterium]|nr:hypothetical protein [Planctomycetaceae bacterium]
MVSIASRLALLAALCWGLIPQSVRAADDEVPEKIEFFETKIRPLFAEHCGECHANGKAKGGFSLETADAARRGGDSGPAFTPGKPDEGLLMEVLKHTGDIKMPPAAKLADSQIADIQKWLLLGAPWPADKGGTEPIPGAGFSISDEQRQFWSFQPVPATVVPPAVKNESWAAGPIDRFVLAELEAKGLTPSPRADKLTLIRRASFDLTGLPPTKAEVEAFLADERPEAWADLIDRLLKSPHYGERWGRHWLDVARYGEDQAHTFAAISFNNGFRYRDWVVKALNEDVPYNEFVRAQIAGDQLTDSPLHEYDRRLAMGYFALGPIYYADAGCAFKASLDELDDRLDTLARGFLGLTIACARCHDHKFDPISQKDYYGLAGIFRSSKYHEAPLVTPEVVQAFEQGQQAIRQSEQAVNKYLDDQTVVQSEANARVAGRYLAAVWRLVQPAPGTEAPKRNELAKESGLHEFLLERWQNYLVPDNKGKLPTLNRWFELREQAANLKVPTGQHIPLEVQAAADQIQASVVGALAELAEARRLYDARMATLPEGERGQHPKPVLDQPRNDLLTALATPGGPLGTPRDKVEGALPEPQKQELATLKQGVETAKKNAPAKYPYAHSLTDGQVGNMKLHIRGNPNRTGDEVPRKFLEVLQSVNPSPFTEGSGRRDLANAIASPNNPLTPRVMVNRLWQNHFGKGIVATPSNFGLLGERPTHPALLDYLARRLIEQNWSLKALHREMMLSAVYQQSSASVPANEQVDAENTWLWRSNRRRLDVESWRDSLLAASGTLDRTLGGAPGNLGDANFNRRTLYGFVSRHALDSLLRLFDFPDPNITSEKRTVTTVPLQQLFVLNGEFLMKQARQLATRLQALPADDATRIREAYWLLYSRPALDEEVALGLAYLQAPTAPSGEGAPAPSGLSRWEQYAQVLLGSNEFTFVD